MPTTRGTGTRPTPGCPRELGRRGEELAARHLERSGLTLLNRNWRGDGGEIDIVLTDGAGLIACEVKTRSGVDFGTPFEAVDQRKVERVRRLALQWLQHHRVGWVPVRVDVVAIVWPADGEPVLTHHPGVC